MPPSKGYHPRTKVFQSDMKLYKMIKIEASSFDIKCQKLLTLYIKTQTNYFGNSQKLLKNIKKGKQITLFFV